MSPVGLSVAPGVQIAEAEIDFSFVRSSGPGGQNVNKVNSKAVLRWNVLESASLSEMLRIKLVLKLAGRITEAGDLVIASDRFRDQGRNREDCLEKLRLLLAGALIDPKPRKKTKATRSSRRKTQVAKRFHSEKKNLRRRPSRDD